MNTNNSILSFLNTTESVVVAANENMNGVIITPMTDAAGNPKTDNNGHPIGSIRLEQHSRTLNGTFLNARKRVAFIGGTMELLESIVKQGNLKDGTKVPGKIVITESLTPMWPTQTPKINPQTNEQIGFEINGTFYPVYAQQTYTDNESTPDRLIRSVEAAMDWLNARRVNEAVSQQNAPVVNTAAVPSADEIVGG